MNEALKRAIERAGGPAALARKLGITHQAVVQWNKAPILRAIEIERVTGVSRHELRPDAYPVEDRAA